MLKIMNSGAVIILLLKMIVEASASYSVSGLYRGVWYQAVEHHVLLGQSFVNISGISVVRCSARCLGHQRCFSFNYDHINHVCQMNNATREHVSKSFEGNKPFSYYDATAEAMKCQHEAASDVHRSPPCNTTDKLGLENGSIPDESLSASSNWVYIRKSSPACGRLNKIPPDLNTTGAWIPGARVTNQWIQVDLGSPTYVAGVLMQGRQDYPNWVTKYKVQYEPSSQASLVDVKDRLGHTKVFDGNTDMTTIVESRFFEPISAVKVRIVPLEWHNIGALRFELLGCK